MNRKRSAGSAAYCESHGKLTYATKRQARAVRHDKGMRAYRCDAGPGWHIGHLPWDVRRGVATAAEVYGGCGE